MSRYIFILVVMVCFGCGNDEAETKEPAAKKTEADLSPVRTFETTSPDVKEPVTEEPTVTPEPVVAEEPKEDLEKQRAYIVSVMGTLKVGDTWQTMIPEAKALLLDKGNCNTQDDGYTWCNISEFKGCEMSETYECIDPNEKAYHYWFTVTFDPSKTISRLGDIKR